MSKISRNTEIETVIFMVLYFFPSQIPHSTSRTVQATAGCLCHSRRWQIKSSCHSPLDCLLYHAASCEVTQTRYIDANIEFFSVRETAKIRKLSSRFMPACNAVCITESCCQA